MAGLLDTIKEKAKQVYGQGLLNQVITNPASVGQELSQLFDPSYLRNIKPMSQETAFDVALSAPMMAGITAWHGSPSVFNKFDRKLAKTGAGAEVYGPGTYLSEGMDLAKGYQPRSDAFENAVGKLSERAYNTDNYIAADIYDNFLLHKTPDEIKSTINEMYQGKDLIEANKALNQAAKLYQTKSKGGLYKVDLPDEYLPSLLNWDDPISSQSKEIQNLAKQYKLKPSDKGEALIGAVGGVEAAAKKLPEFGLQGIKYFDTYSPGSGAGTSNYVVYNPEILKILERNGLLLP